MRPKALFFYLFLLGIFLSGPVFSGCAGPVLVSNQPALPVATITTPPDGSSFVAGQPVVIQFSAADVKGIRQLELSIDGQPVKVEPVNPPVNSYVTNYTWTPTVGGSHTIELHAFNVDGVASEPARVVVLVTGQVEPLPAATLPPATVPVPDTPTSLPPPPTAAPEPSPTPAAGIVSTGSGAVVTAIVGLNVRGGPGTNYPVIGRLVQNQAVPIVGRNPEGTWWQIVYPEDSGGRGWISGSAEFSQASNAGNVPIAEAPVAPTPAPAPTDTPAPLKPVIHSFTADRYTIAPDEKVTLRWDLSGAKAAYLRFNDTEEGIVAPGEKSISPKNETVYTLIARNDAGETTAQVTIKVSGATATPVPVYRDGKTRMVHDQTIDFDQGVIQQGAGGSGADFYWDAQKKQFFPQAGSSGTLFDRSYETIALADCLDTDFGQLPQINPTGRITGCYKTGEGRYGKFWISEWDLAGNLTIVWLTWDTR